MLNYRLFLVSYNSYSTTPLLPSSLTFLFPATVSNAEINYFVEISTFSPLPSPLLSRGCPKLDQRTKDMECGISSIRCSLAKHVPGHRLSRVLRSLHLPLSAVPSTGSGERSRGKRGLTRITLPTLLPRPSPANVSVAPTGSAGQDLPGKGDTGPDSCMFSAVLDLP